MPTVAYAGGFTQHEGGYYVKVWDRTLFGDQAFDLNGDLVESAKFQDHQLNVYAEYGFSNDLTLVGFFTPFGYSKYDDRSTLYAGTFALGIRHALLDGRQPLALEVRAGGRPAIGDGALAEGGFVTGPFVYRATLPTLFLDVELQAAASFGYGIWMSASAGARQHTRSGIGPALLGGLQLGMATSFGLVVDLHAQTYFSVQRPDVIDVLGVGRTDYIGVGLGLAYWITDHIGVTLGVDSAPVSRSNAGAAPLQLGLQLKD